MSKRTVRVTRAQERVASDGAIALFQTLYVDNGDWVFPCKRLGAVIVARKWWLTKPRYWLLDGDAANQVGP